MGMTAGLEEEKNTKTGWGEGKAKSSMKKEQEKVLGGGKPQRVTGLLKRVS